MECVSMLRYQVAAKFVAGQCLICDTARTHGVGPMAGLLPHPAGEKDFGSSAWKHGVFVNGAERLHIAGIVGRLRAEAE